MINNKYLGWLIFVVAGTVFYSWLSYQIGANSDNMSSLLISKDMAEGNIHLDGWSMSTQSYLFSDIIWTAFAIKLFGYFPLLAHIMPALFFSFTALFSLLIVKKKNPKNIFLLAPIILIPTLFTTANAIELNIHGGAYFASAAFIFMTGYIRQSLLPYLLVFLVLVTGIVIDSDKLYIYIFLLPCLFSSLLHLYVTKDKRFVFIAVGTLASFVAAMIVGSLRAQFFHFDIPGFGIAALATPEVMLANFELLLSGMAHYFAIDFSQNTISVVLSGIRLFFLLAFIVLFIRASITSWKSSYVDSLLFFSSGMPVAAFIFSTMPIDVTSTRFIFFSILSASLFTARNTMITKYYGVMFVTVCLWALCNFHDTLSVKVQQNEYYKELGTYLEENGLKTGYAEFWNASILSSVSNVHISPVLTDGLVKPFHWLSKEEWYSRKGNFFITKKKAEKETVIAQFGKPARELSFKGMDILIWEKMPMPPEGFSDMHITKDSLPLRVYRMTDKGVTSTGEKGFMLSGPYINIKPGKYTLTVSGEKIAGNAEIEIFSPTKGISIKHPLSEGQGVLTKFDFSLDKPVDDLEIRLLVAPDDEISISGYTVVKGG
jgi:hypothetical protein